MLVVAKKFKISPVIPIICISIFSNLEGAATLTGDTTSLLLAKEVGMNFFDFFFFNGKIGLFFIVQFSLIAAAITLLILQRKNTDKIKCELNTKVTDYIPTILLCLSIVALIIASFINTNFKLINGVICTSFFIIGLVIKMIKNKSIKCKEITRVPLGITGDLTNHFFALAALSEETFTAVAMRSATGLSSAQFRPSSVPSSPATAISPEKGTDTVTQPWGSS